MDFETRFRGEEMAIRARFPGFRVVEKKDSKFCLVLYWILRVLSLGALDFNEFDTVLGQKLYVGPRWHWRTWASRWVTLRHERIHLEQARKLGFGCFWLGYPLFSILYLLILPAGLTFRAWFEYEAYRETARCNRIAGLPTSRAKLRSMFLGPSYVWMLPIPCLVDKLLARFRGLDP